MTTETPTNRKSWRDLPPEPPFGEVPPAPPRPEPEEPPTPAELALDTPPPRRRRRWAVLWVPLLIGAVLLATAGALWAFRGDDDDDQPSGLAAVEEADQPDGPGGEPPAVPFDQDEPAAPLPDELLPPDFLDRFGRNFFDEFGAELQIPPELLDRFPEFFFEEFGRDFFGEGGPGFGFGFGEDFGELPPDLQSQLDELQRFFDEFSAEGFPDDFGGLFDSLPSELQDQIPGDMPERFGDLFRGFGPEAATAIGGVMPTYLPDGFRVSSASVHTDGRDDFQVEIGLTGPGGPIEVAVLGGSIGETAFQTADGDPVAVAGAEGREDLAGDTRRITYRKDDATVIITAPEGFDRSELLAVAAGLEIDR